MTEYQVHIPLPRDRVHEAWRRYVGFGGTESDEPDLAWQADDGSGLAATFTVEGQGGTLLSATRAQGSDAVPDAVADIAPQTLAEFVEGFVAYVNAAFAELDRSPGATEGGALAGPDGTAHMSERPRSLGTDNSPPA